MRLNKVQQIFNVVKSHNGSWGGTEPENLTGIFFSSWLIRKQEFLLHSKYAKGISSCFK